MMPLPLNVAMSQRESDIHLAKLRSSRPLCMGFFTYGRRDEVPRVAGMGGPYLCPFCYRWHLSRQTVRHLQPGAGR